MTDIYERPTIYEVSIWPENCCIDSDTWKLEVTYRGPDRWSVGRHAKISLSRNGEWDWESRPSEREEEWLAEHRFTLEDALALAREHAPNIVINGMTATEVYARHQARWPDGNCR